MKLNPLLRLLANGPPDDAASISAIRATFPGLPSDYTALLEVATEVELGWGETGYLRIWGASGCHEMNAAHEISKWLPGAVAIGDDGSGRAIVWMHGASGQGLYTVPFGALAFEEARWIAATLTDVLVRGDGLGVVGSR